MRRTVGKTHTLYPEMQWHRHANADCYHCGFRDRAHRMHWLRHLQGGASFALCQECVRKHRAAYPELDHEYEALPNLA